MKWYESGWVRLGEILMSLSVPVGGALLVGFHPTGMLGTILVVVAIPYFFFWFLVIVPHLVNWMDPTPSNCDLQ